MSQGGCHLPSYSGPYTDSLRHCRHCSILEILVYTLWCLPFLKHSLNIVLIELHIGVDWYHFSVRATTSSAASSVFAAKIHVLRLSQMRTSTLRMDLISSELLHAIVSFRSLILSLATFLRSKWPLIVLNKISLALILRCLDAFTTESSVQAAFNDQHSVQVKRSIVKEHKIFEIEGKAVAISYAKNNFK